MYCINYVIKQGDTLYNISRHFRVPLEAIMNANPLINVYRLRVDEVICIPVSMPQNNYTNYTTYLIKEGDTLGNVLDNNGINMGDLMEYNSLDNIHLEPGTTLQIPIVGEGENEMTL